MPTTGYELFSLFHEGDIEFPFVKEPITANELKLVVDDELAECWVAADMAFPRRMECLGIDHTDHVAQIQIAVCNGGHVLAAHFTNVSLVAFGHDDSLAAQSPQTSVHGAKSGELR